MKQDDFKSEKQFLQIHYYFDDDSHSMDAFVRNTMERALLYLIDEIGKTRNMQIKLESQAREEGGLKENIIIISIGALSALTPSLNDVLTFYFTRQNEVRDLEIKLKELELQSKKEELMNKKLQNKQEEDNKIKEERKIYRLRSKFYEEAKNYEKIKTIGYQLDDLGEILVTRDEFKFFIIDKNQDIEVVEEVEIAIVSPVLKKGKYKWKGIYQDKVIDFSMGDSDFKKDVVNQKYNFANGTTIECQLEIKRTFDEYEEEIGAKYSVKKVYGVRTDDIVETTRLGQERKKQKKRDSQPTLFDFLDDKEQQ